MLLEIRNRESKIENHRAWPSMALIGAIAQVKKRYRQLKNRHGPRYTYAMVGVAFFTFFLPLPAISLVSVALVVVIAEIHRAISKRSGFSKTIAKEFVMAINCDVIMQWSATPAQLRTLGVALWRRCNETAGNTGAYQYFDNQALADLLAGEFPVSGEAEQRGAHFRFRDETSHGRQATIQSLRREIPAKAVVDIVVDGTSWDVPGVPT